MKASAFITGDTFFIAHSGRFAGMRPSKVMRVSDGRVAVLASSLPITGKLLRIRNSRTAYLFIAS